MKIQQLRYIREVARHGLNVSATAERLYTSQPGVSKQIRMLEEELDVQIFRREGKHLSEITPAGRVIIEIAAEILDKVEGIKRVAADFGHERQGSLSIATTHTQARYVLPDIIRRFMAEYPDVALHMHQGTPRQISELAAEGAVDFAIATEALELFDNLIMMPCYRWNRSVIVRPDHPLAGADRLTLALLADYPIITYVFGFTGRSQLDRAFNAAGLKPRVVFTAADADVIKTYVKMNLGVGIIAGMAYEAEHDSGLTAIDAAHLFEPSVTRIGFRRGDFLRAYMYEFISMFAPHLTPELVRRCQQTGNKRELEAIFKETVTPDYPA